MAIHKPVLLKESIEALNLKKGDIVVDATLGGGGHSREILKKILPDGKLIAIDQDTEAIENFQDYLKSNQKQENAILVKDNFARLDEVIYSLEIKSIHPHTNFSEQGVFSNKSAGEIGVGVNAIVADLGISSDQLDNSKRGFSFLKCSPLDMRMDKNSKTTAYDVVNAYSEKELARIMKEYGEEKFARFIAKKIVQQRKKKNISTTSELVSVIGSSVPEKYKHQKLHFATKTFQALRMEVNQEIQNLEKFLVLAVELLRPGGRIAIISFHSGEDRIVKKIFAENARGCICPPEFPICCCGKRKVLKIITRKPVVPKVDEIRSNPRSRSAKLRVAEKL